MVLFSTGENDENEDRAWDQDETDNTGDETGKIVRFYNFKTTKGWKHHSLVVQRCSFPNHVI